MVKKISAIWKEIISENQDCVSWITISNFLTIIRILLVPIIVFGISNHFWSFVFVLFLVAGLTDVLDGHLARWLDEQTTLGACLDPIADKIFLISSFSTLSFVDSPSFFIPSWFVFLVVIRESIILGGSFFLLLLGVHLKIVPSIWGKLTTFFQLVFILWIFVCYFVGWNPLRTYSVLLVLLALFSLASLGQYAITGIRYLRGKLQ